MHRIECDRGGGEFSEKLRVGINDIHKLVIVLVAWQLIHIVSECLNIIWKLLRKFKGCVKVGIAVRECVRVIGEYVVRAVKI